MDFSDFNITIVGLGLIGGSYAMALKKLKPKNIWAIDLDKDTLKKAISCGIISEGYTKASEILPKSDMVILALYPQATINFVLDNMEYFKAGCLITDTCGIKENIVSTICNVIRNDIDFIGGHPMAGKETSGFSSADEALFFDANYFITPTGLNSPQNVNILTSLIMAIGCKKIISISPKEHDEIIAYTSHLPHIIAVSLINCLEHGVDLDCSIGGSFKDATRVADINSELWSELLDSNKTNVLNTIDSFINNLNLLKQAIYSGDGAILRNEFNKAKTKRRGIN